MYINVYDQQKKNPSSLIYSSNALTVHVLKL